MTQKQTCRTQLSMSEPHRSNSPPTHKPSTHKPPSGRIHAEAKSPNRVERGRKCFHRPSRRPKAKKQIYSGIPMQPMPIQAAINRQPQELRIKHPSSSSPPLTRRDSASRSTQKLIHPLPPGPSGLLGPLLGQKLREIQLAHTRLQIHLARPRHPRLHPDLVGDVEGQDDRGGQIGLEEIHRILPGRFLLPADGGKAGPELRGQDEQIEDEADPGPDDARLGAEGQLVEGAALHFPGLAEADVGQADGAPGEDGGEAAEGEHPGEGVVLFGGSGEVGEEAEAGGEEDGHERTAALVDVGEDPRRLVLLGEGGKGAGGAVDGGVADREDGDHDDDVHDRVQALDAGVEDGDDEGGGVGIGRVSADEASVRVGHEEADENEGDDVEEADAPEDLLDRCGEGLAWVGGLGRCEPDELGAGEGEGSGHEDGTKTFEAVVEGAGVGPVFATDIAAVGATSDIEDNSEDAGWELAFGLKERDEVQAHMKPMTAMTLMIAKANSASAYPLTPNRLMETMTVKKMVTQTAFEI